MTKIVTAFILASVALTATAAPPVKLLTFEEAAAKAVDIKSCPKKQISKITVAKLIPPNQGFNGIYFEVSDSEESSGAAIGPLGGIPSNTQLNSLKGKKACMPMD